VQKYIFRLKQEIHSSEISQFSTASPIFISAAIDEIVIR
jgi:hypothetical protein